MRSYRLINNMKSVIRAAQRGTFVFVLTLGGFIVTYPAETAAQETQPARAPMDRVLGTVTAVDAASQTFTIKEDKTGSEFVVSTAKGPHFYKVPPGETDLKKAQPTDASQIMVGDRLLARGHKDAAVPAKLEAAIVIVMTAGELQQKHESELADWQKRGSRGTLVSVDPNTKSFVMALRGAGGQKLITVATTDKTQFVRYAPNSAQYSDAKSSSFTELKPGDQLRILGNNNAEGTHVTAEKIISGAFRTVAATIVSVSADGKQIQATDTQTKQPLTVALTDETAVRQLSPAMAGMLAARVNGRNNAGGSGNPGPLPGSGAAREGGPRAAIVPGEDGGKSSGTPAGATSPVGGAAGANGPHPGGGDLSQMLERVPKIAVSDLKPGSAVVISGSAGDDRNHLTAINIVAGVESLLASTPSSGGRSSALGMWNLDVGTPGEQ